MKRTFLVLVFLLGAWPAFGQSAPQEAKLILKITTQQSTALVGEAVFFSAKVTNEGPVTANVKVNSGDVLGPWLYMKCCKEALVIKAPDGHIQYGSFGVLYAVLKPGQSKTTSEASPGGLVLHKPGQYEVWAELQSTGVAAFPTIAPNLPRYEYFWKGHAVSNTLSIDILAPTGIDAEAYKAFNGEPMKHLDGLLQRFPTSTYAGYALAEKVQDYSNPLFHPVPPAKQVKMAYEEGKTYVIFPDKAFEKYFQQVGTFLKGGRVPESLRTVLWSFYGDQLVRRGRFAGAQEAFREATGGAPPLDAKSRAYYDRAEGFLKAFKAEKAGKEVAHKP